MPQLRLVILPICAPLHRRRHARADAAGEAVGSDRVNCPICSRATRVLQTRDKLDRQRECTQGHRFWTREVLRVPDQNPIKKPA
jgi:hypothetical protein